MYAAKSCCPHRQAQDDGRRPQYDLVSDARGRLRRLLQVWQTSVPATLLLPRGMQGVLPCSPGMVKTGAHNTIDGLEARGGALPYLLGTRVDGAHNTVGENVGAYNTASILPCQVGHRILPGRCIGYGPWYCGLTCAPCLTFSVRFLVLTERASLVGWPQSALIAPVEEEQ